MSAAAGSEERGNKRGNNEGRQTGQQRQSTAPRDGTTQSRRGGKASAPAQNVNSKTPETPSTPILPPQDDHVPLKGFNIVEVDSLLKKGFDPTAPVYKPESQPHKSGSVWGTQGMQSQFWSMRRITDRLSAGAMANGKDFWLELRKQVTALQQTGGVSQGG